MKPFSCFCLRTRPGAVSRRRGRFGRNHPPPSLPFHAELAGHVPHRQRAAHAARRQEATARRPGHHVDELRGEGGGAKSPLPGRGPMGVRARPGGGLPASAGHQTACWRDPRSLARKGAPSSPREPLKPEQTFGFITSRRLIKDALRGRGGARFVTLTFAPAGCQASRHRDLALLTSLVFCSSGQRISWD